MKLHHGECTSPNHPQFVLPFPPELLDQIITYFMRDPDTTFDELKSLRLVCRSFNCAAAPRVLSCVRLFGIEDSPMFNMRQLQAIVSSDLNGHLYATKTLVMGHWKWRCGNCRLFVSFREMRNSGLSGIILNSTVHPLACLLVILFAPHFVPLYIYDSVIRLCTRYRLSRGSVLNMPNVRRVVWKGEIHDPNWIASSTVKLLLDFHQLSELVLLIHYEQDLNHISKCFSRLHNLRKLKIDVIGYSRKLYQNRSYPFNYLGSVIGANLNLTHLELFQDNEDCGPAGNLSKIFDYVPSNSPLKLEHLGISDSFSDAWAIASHARSLRSIGLSAHHRLGILTVLRAECIFPPIIQASRVDDYLIDYLGRHPQIVGLSIHGGDQLSLQTMLEIMAQHSESLKYFSTSPLEFFDVLKRVENEFLFLRCTKLEQLTLNGCYVTYWDAPQDMIMALSIIARLPSLLTLVITGTKILAFEACIKHCSQSENPLVRNLTKRIIYEQCPWSR